MHISIQNEFLTIDVVSKGAELYSLKTDDRKYLWNGNSEFWGKHSPILFPIVGTLKNNSYQLNNKEYNLPRHGFARDLEFERVDVQSDFILFSLKANEKTLENYPFDFELQIKYIIHENILTVQYKVINNSNKKMPFSIGAHPAFSMPKGFENYSFEFSDDEYPVYHLLENGLITDKSETLELKNKILPLKYKTFENDALVFKTLKSKSITILENSKPFIKVNFEKFPNLGIWTVQNADFICIEPWFGYSDTINSNGNLFKKEGIIILDENQCFETEYSIEIV
jgi:galactose mutarotase-like enzyme